MPGVLRDLGATLLAALLAVLPAWGELRGCPDVRAATPGALACCAAPASAAPAACCCEGEPAQGDEGGSGPSLSPPGCECSAVPAGPQRPARADEVAAQAPGRELRAAYSALAAAVAPEPCAPALEPRAQRAPPGHGAPAAGPVRGGPERLYLLGVALL
jgi:hypothetical protein